MSPSAAAARSTPPLARQRPLLWAMLLSIALHALVLLGVFWDAPAPPAKALLVLTARLAPFAVAPNGPVQPLQPKIAPTPPRQPDSKAPTAAIEPATSPRAPKQKTASAEAAKTPPLESAPAAPGSEASAVQSGTPLQAKAASQAPSGAPSAEAGAKAGTEVDAGTLEQYRLALIVATRRYKRYPAIAMEKGWQGRVEVHLVIGSNGMIASTSIKSSSGHEILDNQALDMLKKGKTTVPIPAALRGREFPIDVPVIFNLENPNS